MRSFGASLGTIMVLVKIDGYVNVTWYCVILEVLD